MIGAGPIVLHLTLFTLEECHRIAYAARQLGIEVRENSVDLTWEFPTLFMDSADAEAFFELAEVDV